jgi:uncharacterized protein (DUF488 family)
MSSNVIGIGYEGLDLEALVARLRLREISVVVDIRLNPISRKKGLSKTALSQRLLQEGIQYEHLSSLGNPRDNREAFADAVGTAGREARFRFEAILGTDRAQESLERIAELAQLGGVALLCFEHDEALCHRELVLEALHGRLVDA